MLTLFPAILVTAPVLKAAIARLTEEGTPRRALNFRKTGRREANAVFRDEWDVRRGALRL